MVYDSAGLGPVLICPSPAAAAFQLLRCYKIPNEYIFYLYLWLLDLTILLSYVYLVIGIVFHILCLAF